MREKFAKDEKGGKNFLAETKTLDRGEDEMTDTIYFFAPQQKDEKFLSVIVSSFFFVLASLHQL